MPFAPLVTVVTTVTVAVAAMLAVTARRDLAVPYARRSPAFKSVVTHHRHVATKSFEGDYSQNSEASSRSLTRKSTRALTQFNRAPPVQQLPDPDLDVICNYWLRNQPKGRGNGDYSFDEGDPTLAVNLRDLEHRSHQNPRRAPPVQQLPEPTVDEICQKWLETKLPRKASSLSQKSTSLQTQRAANGYKSPMTSSPVHSPPRSHNNNQPLLFLYRIHQTARSSRNMPPILTPDYNFPSFYPISYNPYPQLPTSPPYCPFYTKENIPVCKVYFITRQANPFKTWRILALFFR
ncbi:Protein of unknown function [Gryllus bimaculatus]|nr:Protein of unknown function [Gryllus bimaculatus]